MVQLQVVRRGVQGAQEAVKVLGEEPQAVVGNLVQRLLIVQRDDLEVPTEFAERRPVRGDTVALMQVKAEASHQVHAFLPDSRMARRDRHLLLHVRENAVCADGLNMDVRLRGAGFPPLMLANEH